MSDEGSVTSTVQGEAIAYRGGHLLLLGGPGAGKTWTSARRAAALIDEAHDAGREPPEILMLTFARKAAHELRACVKEHLRSGGRLPTCSTFPAFALEVQSRVRPHRLDERAMLTPTKERLLVEGVCRRTAEEHPERVAHFTLAALRSARFASDLANVIGRCKQAGVTPEGVMAAARSAAGAERAALAEIASLYRSYEEERTRLVLHDFRDLVVEASAALRTAPRAYAHVFVDELQDTDHAQLEMLTLLAEAGATITAAGDPNQSIYRFRNVVPAAIADLRHALSPHVLVFDESQRCPADILAAVNRLAETPPLACETLARSAVEHAGELHWYHFLDPAEEAAGVAREIRRLIDTPRADGNGVLRYRDVAILVRSPERHAERLAHALRSAEIPVVRSAAAEFLGDPGVDFVLTWLKALAAPPDAQRLFRLLSSPVVGIRPRSVRFAQRRACAEAGDLAALALSPELSEEERAHIARVSEVFERQRASWRTLGAGVLVREIARDHDVPGSAQLDALIALANDVDAVAGRAEAAAIELAHRATELFTLLADAEEAPSGDGVQILSMHAAKGRQFPVVFIPAVVHGELPAPPRPDPLLDDAAQEALYHTTGMPRPPLADEQREEELRLFYVACTRASERLVLTSYAQREGADVASSPYLAGLGLVEPDAPAEQRAMVSTHAFEPEPPASPPLRYAPFSARAIETYLRCPRQFFFRYVARAEGEERESAHALLGSVLHDALAVFHDRHPRNDALQALGETRVAEILCSEITPSLARELRGDRYAGLREQASVIAGLRDRAHDYALRYVRWLLAAPAFAVRDRERQIDFTLQDGNGRVHAFTGRIDRVDETAEGLVIRDYKTGREHTFAARFRKLAANDAALPLGQLDGCAQLPLYAAALQQHERDATIAALDLLFLRGKVGAERIAVSRLAPLSAPGDAGKRERNNAITPEELRGGLQRIADLCGALRDGRASYAPHPSKSACTHCAYRLACDRVPAEDEPEANGDPDGE